MKQLLDAGLENIEAKSGVIFCGNVIKLRKVDLTKNVGSTLLVKENHQLCVLVVPKSFRYHQV